MICFAECSYFLHYFEFAVVIYNTQKGFTINHENGWTNHFPWPALYFIMQCFPIGLCLLVFQACITLLHCASHDTVIHWFSHKETCLLYLYVFAVQLIQYLILQWKGIIIHLPFIVASVIIVRLHVNGQYSANLGSNPSSFCSNSFIMCACVLHLCSLQL